MIETIINRDDSIANSVEEMIEVVKHYIEKRKGRSIQINIMRGLPPQNHPLFGSLYFTRVNQLANAFTIAKVWLKENKTK